MGLLQGGEHNYGMVISVDINRGRTFEGCVWGTSKSSVWSELVFQVHVASKCLKWNWNPRQSDSKVCSNSYCATSLHPRLESCLVTLKPGLGSVLWRGWAFRGIIYHGASFFRGHWEEMRWQAAEGDGLKKRSTERSGFTGCRRLGEVRGSVKPDGRVGLRVLGGAAAAWLTTGDSTFFWYSLKEVFKVYWEKFLSFKKLLLIVLSEVKW